MLAVASSVNCGIWALAVISAAIARRIGVKGTRRSPEAIGGAAIGWAAAWMSFSVIRLRGPEPLTVVRSIPSSRAIRRASGEALKPSVLRLGADVLRPRSAARLGAVLAARAEPEPSASV